MKKISILLPVYNEEGLIELLERSMLQVADENSQYLWEFLIVNDGSTDHTLPEIVKLHRRDKRFSYIDLSRNFGKEIALMAGFDHVDADAVIIMDGDMQHPIEIIPEMLQFWEEGYDDVYAQRTKSKERWFKRKSSQLYYRILQRVSHIPIPCDVGDFRLLDRSCVAAINQMRETQRNTKGMYSWIGFNKKGISYEQKKRQIGKSKWSFLSLLDLAVSGVTSYTIAPLRIATIIGIVVSLAGFTYLSYIIISTLLFGEVIRGYPTIMVTILFMSGIQLISIGIIGEYLGRVFNEVKQRPGYFIKSYNGRKEEHKSL